METPTTYSPLIQKRWKITFSYLNHALPLELPYRGHILKRMPIQLSDDAIGVHVMYRCDTFFDCSRHNPAIVGHLMFGRAHYKDDLVNTLRQELRRMYWGLERVVAHEATQGCAILPPAT